MERVLLACATIRGELERAMARAGFDSRKALWVESGLHDTPELLREAIQGKLDSIEPGTLVLCGFGACGNAVVGLRSGAHHLLLPRVDDCITWLAGGWPQRKEWEADGAVYFMTPAWAEGEHSLHNDYRYAVGKFGKEMADDLYGNMLKHYRYLGVVETGVYDAKAFAETMKPAAEDLKLEIRRFRGNLSWMEALFEEVLDEKRFLLIPPHTTVTAKTLMY